MLNLRPIIHEPIFLRKLFASPRSAWLWLVVRVWLGYYWIDSSFQKIVEQNWVANGNALRTYWHDLLSAPSLGKPSFAYDWYQSLLRALLDAGAESWLSPLVVYAELLVGAALILGAFTGLAAFLGAFIHWNFLLAGVTSANPLVFVAAVGLVMAWKAAGYFGLDYYLLHWLSRLGQAH